jgi:GTP-binding protein
VQADQVKKAELEARIAETAATLKQHPAAFPDVIATSSRNGDGIAELRAAMMRLLAERS